MAGEKKAPYESDKGDIVLPQNMLKYDFGDDLDFKGKIFLSDFSLTICQ